eukprot:TRINITY_DN2393_c0_g1_i3.p1 TRINITY_DN2393_c0_g1~~TRINITY_DN2393_c0_g1_i3.p1  ORF type:complete len:277 (+),score=72.19 TRINITY_DN2393_c0_g1_i3:60-833(+)
MCIRDRVSTQSTWGYRNRYKKLKVLSETEGQFFKVYLAEEIECQPSKEREEEAKETNTYSKILTEAYKRTAGLHNLSQDEPDKPAPGAPRVIKKLKKKHKIQGDGVSFAVLREIGILKETCLHPNIVKLVDVFYHKENVMIVQEYLPVGLDDIVRSYRALNFDDIKYILRGILQGLMFLHGSWIIHRDLKPGNIRLADDTTVKIIDFNMSRYFGNPSRAMTKNVGTQFYRAPEILLDAEYYGPVSYTHLTLPTIYSV